ncbi:MAG: sulfatase-like hydrolase/transferase [Saprospiraceae bacterium]
MKKNTHLIVFLLICSMQIYFANRLCAQQNTILIIADDLSPDYLGLYGISTDTVVAPNIRSLLKNGIKFNNVWSSPLCSPTRAGIFTGRYPFRTGVGNVITNGQSAQLDTAEMSIAKLLKYYAPVKYQTANVGKWHLHVQMPQKYSYPNKMGYDFYSGSFNGEVADYYKYTRITNGKLDTVKTYATTQTVNDAIGWMKTLNPSKPFFLWLAFNAPHFPFHLPPSTLCNTAGLSGTTADIKNNPKKYFKSTVQAMDTEIGRLFQYLKDNNLMDNTNIIFIGDNGNDNRVAQISDKTKAKATLYDYGVRVPMIISGPAVVNPNRSSDALVNTPDIFATVADLCNFPNWKNAIPTSKIVDSKSMLPIIKNESTYTRDWIFTELFSSPVDPDDGKTARNKDYHLIRWDNGKEGFFKQSTDYEEKNNLLNRALSAEESSNYTFLCSNITALVGTGNCKSVAIDDIINAVEVNLFPNPAGEYAHVKSEIPVKSITLLNALGEVSLVGTNATITLISLPEGFYTIIIELENELKITKKIIISK